MNYIKLPYLDCEVSIFDICQAHAQLESDYNVGGWVRERPSNQRRMEATSVQLSRIGFDMGHRWVEICSDENSDEDEMVRSIYLINVMKWGLPIDDEMQAYINKTFTQEFIQSITKHDMKKDTGGPMFPMQDQQAIHAYAMAVTADIAPGDKYDEAYLRARAEAIGGATIYDLYASKAMQALLTLPVSEDMKNYPNMRVSEYIAKQAGMIARAMLKERENG